MQNSDGNRKHPEPKEGRCNAHTRDGGYCWSWPTRNNGRRCRLHGGAVGSGRPPIHGRYSKVVKAALREKLGEFLADPDYQSVAEELALQRALFAQYLETLQGRTLTVEDTAQLLSWLTRITMTAERASRIESRTALTIAEVRLLEVGIVNVLQQLLGPKEAAEFSRRLAAMLGARSLQALPESQSGEIWGGMLS